LLSFIGSLRELLGASSKKVIAIPTSIRNPPLIIIRTFQEHPKVIKTIGDITDPTTFPIGEAVPQIPIIFPLELDANQFPIIATVLGQT
jgi:hypothetical protein